VVAADNRVYAYYFRPTVSPEGTQATVGSKAFIGGNRMGAWTEEDKQRFAKIEADEVVVCMDAATGMTMWKRAFIKDGFNLTPQAKNGPFNTPCVARGKVYAQGTRGQVFCLDAATGGLVWRRDFGDKSNLVTFALQEADGVVLVAGHERSRALDAETGREAWGPGPFITKARGTGEPGPVRWIHQGTAYFVSQSRCVRASDGRECWTVPGHGAFTTVSGDYLVVGGIGRGLAKLNLKPGDPPPCIACYRMTPTAAEKIWELTPNITGFHFSGPVAYQGHVYGSSSCEGRGPDIQFCVELATGKVKATIEGRADDYYGWLAQDGMIFHYKKMGFYKADPQDFRLLPGRLPFVSEDCITPLLVDGRLFFRSNGGHLVCYDLRQPQQGQPPTR
jgi:outer membrane protein assembly factor BamB